MLYTNRYMETILEVRNLTKSFRSLTAVDNISFAIPKGACFGLLGPNGAGKTTMMDVITGKTKPDNGTVLFNNTTDLTQFDEAAVANIGVGRKFQKPSVIESLTVFENLELSQKGGRGIWQALFHSLSNISKTHQLIKDILYIFLKYQIQ